MRAIHFAAFGVSLLIALGGCSAQYLLNKPIAKYSATRAERARNARPRQSSDRVFVVLTFSGGGTRAAAFAYGVLEELAATQINFDGRDRSLLDEVDIVSGVSGGSFAAAYFGLHGHDTLQTFPDKFLYRDVEHALKRAVFSPRNWGKLGSSTYSRSDLAAEYLDRTLFDHATFLDMARQRGASVIINATDLSRGAPFSFIGDQFASICSDLGSVPLARAVVASAAVPVLFSPITLKNYAGSCGYQTPDWVRSAKGLGGSDATQRGNRRAARTELFESYLDSANRPYIHLVDGGLSDNLGLRAVLDSVITAGGIRQAVANLRLSETQEILIVVVNAQTGLDQRWDKSPSGPSTAAVIEAATTVQINRYNFETVELLRSSIVSWANDLRPERPVNLHVAELNFDQLADPQKRQHLKSLPTSFALPRADVDELRATARDLLRASTDFAAFKSEIAAGLPAASNNAEPH